MQRIERRSSPFFLNQHIIRVIGRNREDWNALRREWFDKREQHPRLREREWPMQLQAHPVMLDLDAVRQMNGRTHNGQFIPGSGDRCELALRRPFGHWFFRCLAHDGVRLSQAAEFELMSHENRTYQNCTFILRWPSAPPPAPAALWNPMSVAEKTPASRAKEFQYSREPPHRSPRPSAPG